MGKGNESSSSLPPVPTGIQKLLRLAREDSAFRELLLKRRGDIALAAGVKLNASELAILTAVSPSQLASMVARVPAATPDRRDFLRQTAASAVVLLGGIAMGESLAGCAGPQGSDPGPAPGPAPGPFAEPPPDDPVAPSDEPMHTDEPVDRPDHHHMAPGGARPDMDAGPPPVSRGIAPDMPPERPDHPDTIRMGGAAPDMPPPRGE